MKVVGKEKVVKAGMMEQIKREISVMSMVKHPNIVELYEVMASKTKIYFAMELVRGGELFAKISKGRLREESARNYFHHLISAVDFCHSRGVYHRDLKPENLLLDDDGNLKVTDFGLSAFSDHLRHDGLLHTTCGTPAYVAPEVIGKKGYDGAKADIWSCGVILYVLLAGFLPFQDDNVEINHQDVGSQSEFENHHFQDYGFSLVQEICPQALRSKEEEEFTVEDEGCLGKAKDMESLNAFHIISLSQGLEEVAKTSNFSIKKSDSSVRLQGHESGRKGKLGISADLFAFSPSFLVVEVKKASGDTLEYNQFCTKELRPALKDIVWTSPST
nr:CBL-interacting serine/threonine-protein kinase 6-like [Ipomoea trifida]